jgi:iron complex transport system ATP-binding protein
MIGVRATDLVLAYGANVALERSSFEIPAGMVTALIGPNGSGKSSVLNAVSGLLSPASGTITIEPPVESHRIAYVLQTTKVNDALPISVREVVTMGRYHPGSGRLRTDDREAVDAAIARLGIAELASEQLHSLSGGQRQRVLVAQGLAQDHDILLLDEPMTAVDLPTAQAIDEVVHEEREKGRTVVITTHDLTEARVADHVLLLSRRVVASGPPAEALSVENLTSAYGPSLLHLAQGQVFLDDPAHVEARGRHAHRERAIHTETSPTDFHADD